MKRPTYTSRPARVLKSSTPRMSKGLRETMKAALFFNLGAVLATLLYLYFKYGAN